MPAGWNLHHVQIFKSLPDLPLSSLPPLPHTPSSGPASPPERPQACTASWPLHGASSPFSFLILLGPVQSYPLGGSPGPFMSRKQPSFLHIPLAQHCFCWDPPARDTVAVSSPVCSPPHSDGQSRSTVCVSLESSPGFCEQLDSSISESPAPSSSPSSSVNPCDLLSAKPLGGVGVGLLPVCSWPG